MTLFLGILTNFLFISSCDLGHVVQRLPSMNSHWVFFLALLAPHTVCVLPDVTLKDPGTLGSKHQASLRALTLPPYYYLIIVESGPHNSIISYLLTPAVGNVCFY